MLQDIRSNIQGTLAKIIIGLIVVSFSIFGIESILLGGGGSGVAEVNGEEISPLELQQTVNLQRRQLLSMLGENVDPALLDDDRLTSQAVETLIERKLLVQSASNLGLTVSEEAIGRIVGSMEQFQIDGRFSPEMYRSILSSAGFTPALFKQSLREDMITNQLQAGLAASDFATPAELLLRAEIGEEQRDLRYLTLPLEQFENVADVDEASIVAYYDANPSEFLSEESVDLRYIEVTAAQFVEPVEEARLREEFALTRGNFEVSTESRVAHILFVRGDDESETDFTARIAAAQSALVAGEDFADLAAAASDDIGSASLGGDLGFTSGDTFPEPMEAAIANLNVGAVSGPVITEAGTHLITLLERREGTEVAFEDVRAELEQRLQETESRAELVRVVEQLRDLAFSADNLSAPAEQLGLTINQAQGVVRGAQEGLFASPLLQSAVFSEDVLELGHNSEVVELASDRFVVAEVQDHRQPEQKPLAAVRDTIATRIAVERARERALAEAKRIIEELGAGAALDAIANAGGYQWQVELGATRSGNTLPRALSQRTFALRQPDVIPVRDIVTAPSGDVYVMELTRVAPGSLEDLPAARQEALKRGVAAEFGRVLIGAYESSLRADADIEVY